MFTLLTLHPSSGPSLIVLMVTVDVKEHGTELNLSSKLRSSVKIGVADMGSLSVIDLMVSVDVKQH